MLETLSIKNIAVIDSAEISFKPGLNILSGETGAGKSIVIEAISLLLGSRASAELIRSSCEEATVEGLFDISNIPWIKTRMDRAGFPTEHSELLIKRVVSRSGRHRIYINGELATLAILQDLCEGLVDLCGQHEHQSLLKAATQLELLDRYGGLTDQSKSVGITFTHVRSLSKKRDALQMAERERAQKSEFLKFQIEELRAANLSAGEDERLQAEKQLLQSCEARAQLAEEVRQALESQDEAGGGALDSIRSAISKVRTLSQLDDRAIPVKENLERALAELEDASLSINRYLESTELNPNRLTEVQDRLAQLADLRRKYGTNVSEMLTALARLENEYSALGHMEEQLSEVISELEKAKKELLREGQKLSKERKKVSDLLAKSVTDELKDLKMGEARFQIELQASADISDWTPSGADSIQFVVQTNRGEAARPLQKIASGGELSRLMLAIRRVIADRGGIGVYLFDEIDAGIGGQTAFQVGKKLKSVAQFNQVICITHLPQVASFADHHLSVRKRTTPGRTITEVIELDKQERKNELARMLGGPQLTKKSLENAEELLDLAR
jgi:DNA repair protein RecN (Recombination protein N)